MSERTDDARSRAPQKSTHSVAQSERPRNPRTKKATPKPITSIVEVSLSHAGDRISRAQDALADAAEAMALLANSQDDGFAAMAATDLLLLTRQTHAVGEGLAAWLEYERDRLTLLERAFACTDAEPESEVA